MIGAFPRRGDWITLTLAGVAEDHDDEQLVLLELAGECPGDPAAQATHVTNCTSRSDALRRACDRLAAGWAAYATAERRPPANRLFAALRVSTATQPASDTDTAVRSDIAIAVVAHAAGAEPGPYCLFPDPNAATRRAPK